MKRRSWQTELPHIGDARSGTCSARKASSSASTAASSSVDARTRAVSPERPWVPVFHASIASSTASAWCTTSTGACATVRNWLSVTTSATSMMRSRSGSSPVISMSTQMRLSALAGMLSSTGGKTDVPMDRESTGLRLRAFVHSRSVRAGARGQPPGRHSARTIVAQSEGRSAAAAPIRPSPALIVPTAPCTPSPWCSSWR